MMNWVKNGSVYENGNVKVYRRERQVTYRKSGCKVATGYRVEKFWYVDGIDASPSELRFATLKDAKSFVENHK